MVQPGDVIDGKYELMRLIGRGGMGSVFAARHLEIGRLAALKFLHPQVSCNATMVTRFIREARAAAAIGSEHIVDVTDVGRLPDGSPYLVMEYLEGEDLATIGAREKRLEPTKAVSYCVQLCEALAQAHRRGIVHRDIKPQNIFVTRRAGRSDWIKVLDFGIAKFRAELTGESTGLTGPGVSLGTPQYMAMEQFTSNREVDGRTDVYSVGVVLYLTLTGRIPFRGKTHEEVVLQIATGTLESPRTLRPELDETLSKIVLQAMARLPEDRFQTMDELARALLPFAGPDCAYQPALQVRRNPEELFRISKEETVTGDRADSVPTQPGQEAGARDKAAEEDFVPTAAELAFADSEPTDSEPLNVRTPTSWQVEAAPPIREPGSSIKVWIVGGIVLVSALVASAILMGGNDELPADTAVSQADEAAATPSPTDRDRTADSGQIAPNRWVSVTPAQTGTILGLPSELVKQGTSGFRPERGVTAPVYPYQIQQHEVTWAELQPWLGERGRTELASFDSTPDGQNGRYPATGILWSTALDYCRSLGGVLPTEEEWEYAARGRELHPYPWGTGIIDLARTHVYRGGSHVSPVMTNDQDVTPGDAPRAIYDLLGNAREWTASLYRLDTPATPEEEAWTQEGGRTFRTVRGLPPNEEPSSALPRVGLAHRFALCATGHCATTPEEEQQYRNAMRNIGFRCARRVGSD